MPGYVLIMNGGRTRMTLDLDTAQRAALARWAALAGVQIGRARLSSAEVLRAAIELLDPPGEDASEHEQLLRQAFAHALIEHLAAGRR